jgi:hypothetical protein
MTLFLALFVLWDIPSIQLTIKCYNIHTLCRNKYIFQNTWFLFYVISELYVFFIDTRHIVLVVYSNYHLVSNLNNTAPSIGTFAWTLLVVTRIIQSLYYSPASRCINAWMHSLKKSVKPEIVNRYDLWVLRHKIGGAKVFVNNVQWSDHMM